MDDCFYVFDDSESDAILLCRWIINAGLMINREGEKHKCFYVFDDAAPDAVLLWRWIINSGIKINREYEKHKRKRMLLCYRTWHHVQN